MVFFVGKLADEPMFYCSRPICQVQSQIRNLDDPAPIEYEERVGISLSFTCANGCEAHESECRPYVDAIVTLFEHPRFKPVAVNIQGLKKGEVVCEEVARVVVPALCKLLTRGSNSIPRLDLTYPHENAQKDVKEDFLERVILPIRDALFEPNNRLNKIRFTRVPTLAFDDLCGVFGEAIQRGTLKVTDLVLKEMAVHETMWHMIGKLVQMPSSCVSTLRLDCCSLDLTCKDDGGVVAIAHWLRCLSCLKIETQRHEPYVNGNIMSEIGEVLRSPGNQLHHLVIKEIEPDFSFIRAIGHSECKLTTLTLRLKDYDDSVVYPVLVAKLPQICGTLQEFEYHGRSACADEQLKVLASCLRIPGNQLKRLMLVPAYPPCPAPSAGACAVFHAIRDSPNHMTQLCLTIQPDSQVMESFAQMLSCDNCRLTSVGLHNRDPICFSGNVTRAIRTSNLSRLVYGDSEFFFNWWFKTFLVLTSVPHVPRISDRSLFRILPVMDLIFKIAATLGWDLNRLR